MRRRNTTGKMSQFLVYSAFVDRLSSVFGMSDFIPDGKSDVSNIKTQTGTV